MTRIDKKVIIKLNGGTISFIDEENLYDECVIYDLYVDKKHRHQGIGSMLIELALYYIFKQGYKKAFIVVRDKSLVSFYEKLGFVKTKENEMYFYKKEKL